MPNRNTAYFTSFFSLLNKENFEIDDLSTLFLISEKSKKKSELLRVRVRARVRVRDSESDRSSPNRPTDILFLSCGASLPACNFIQAFKDKDNNFIGGFLSCSYPALSYRARVPSPESGVSPCSVPWPWPPPIPFLPSCPRQPSSISPTTRGPSSGRTSRSSTSERSPQSWPRGGTTCQRQTRTTLRTWLPTTRTGN